MAEMSYIIGDLTFIYTSFAKIFCQNKIKKNRKYVTRFFVENAHIKREKRCGIIYPVK